jgi:hypothetical protein
MDARLEALPLKAKEFCARVIPALSDRGAENGLPFGIAQRLAARPELARDAVLLAIEEGGAIDESIGFVFVCPFDPYSLGPPGVMHGDV